MMKLYHSHKSANEYENNYRAGFDIHTENNKRYSETFSNSAVIQRKYKHISLYKIWRFGKLAKIASIYSRFNGTFDVDISEHRTFGKHEFKRIIYAGNFRTLNEAVKALYLHCKED